MTSHQTKKYLNSQEFESACRLVYPFGYDEETDMEKINLVGGRLHQIKSEWESIYNSAVNLEDWNAEENLPNFHRACSAETNADDSAIVEKRFEVGSVAYYSCAISTYEMSVESED